MRTDSDQPINIVGAGLAGALLGVILMRHGCGAIRLWDRRPDPRRSRTERGRSINLALAARGIRALEHAGVMQRIRPLLIPMRGRMIHERSGATALQPYGQRDDEVIYSVGRAQLNRVLIEEAARHQDVTIRFNQTCLAADPAENALRFRNEVSGAQYQVELTPTIATDGAGSAVRGSLLSTSHVTVREDWLDHDYKELTIPPVDGRPALDPNALHIWPRGGFMLIALPNTDLSFTATLFLARTGPRSFASLPDSQAVLEFFLEEFPDAVPLIPNLAAEFQAHPAGQLGTVHTAPWRVGGQVLLLGDAAHAIVPFHGQGMNAAFEDCVVLDSLLDRFDDWAALFAEFERVRRPNTEAIAQMALENYTEMRDTVLDAGFVRRKALALELERRFPDRFIPRYAMVTFHPEIEYSEALRRGALQAQILLELDRDDGRTDFALAQQLISERLPALARA
ncbi:MAG TPA: NAD(P)/FAD-dependent oxidoreductase [Steroidobacteraceae bacterium]|nr:NAD(P)/FAD-dependent oxidoreductase [Steroidobacteraceae bacterium]